MRIPKEDERRGVRGGTYRYDHGEGMKEKLGDEPQDSQFFEFDEFFLSNVSTCPQNDLPS